MTEIVIRWPRDKAAEIRAGHTRLFRWTCARNNHWYADSRFDRRGSLQNRDFVYDHLGMYCERCGERV